MRLRNLTVDQRGASAVEFALIVPVMILFLLGIIDVGRFIWNTNELEKAVQIGARWAVATDIIPGDDTATGLKNYSFAVSGGIPQGETVPKSSFPGVKCTSTAAGAVTCSCKVACGFSTATNGDSFDNLVGRMNQIYAGVGNENVEVDYDWSGLGYSGDPFGSDVDPLVTVTIKDVDFRPIFLAGIFNFGLPDLSYTLTMEDGVGDFSN
ncbi:TadE/TadG family type IV pilus assembly protein [Croceicoccus mobilis]|uniref:Pilus biosynthesis protein TadE n=1 Tax=Croceicoccus mobilis TaxID=1703339 RepID=A0A916YRE8_9SPHN|nr:TadE/TadG family type IV pilus assembly protein [Croceicoccus mobilis]GGD57357.1 pilus biosynthesis protein TadE [Croceicoccus mobilis]